MRFLLGTIFGILLTLGTVFVADSLATDAAGAYRQIVNWDVAGDRLNEFIESIHAGWNKLTR
jgi:hypothetical protein